MAEKAEKHQEQTPAPQHQETGGLSPEIADKVIRMGRPKAKPLEDRYFSQREVRQNEWHCFLGANVTLQDVQDRDFWAFTAMKLKPGDKIVCMSEDRRMYVEVIVFAVGGKWAEVRVFGEPIVVSRHVAQIGLATDYVVRDLGLIKKWAFVHAETGREVQSGFNSEDQARGALGDYLRQQGLARRVA